MNYAMCKQHMHTHHGGYIRTPSIRPDEWWSDWQTSRWGTLGARNSFQDIRKYENFILWTHPFCFWNSSYFWSPRYPTKISPLNQYMQITCKKYTLLFVFHLLIQTSLEVTRSSFPPDMTNYTSIANDYRRSLS